MSFSQPMERFVINARRFLFSVISSCFSYFQSGPLVYIPYFKKMQKVVWDHLVLSIYTPISVHLTLYPLFYFVRRLMRSPCCLCVCPLIIFKRLKRSRYTLWVCVPSPLYLLVFYMVCSASRRLKRSPCCLYIIPNFFLVSMLSASYQRKV
jgi:hypothetical protein